ncbi:hypothetical protein AB1Y20_019811 [Prymnesium parvum]|uniref:UBX domain-containing protein n=1 Tax=Prymnesium parvum TaxID=97485 RepID=A0AB34JW84_PRYPA
MADFSVSGGVYKRGDREKEREEAPPKDAKKKELVDEVGEALGKISRTFSSLLPGSKDKKWAKKGEGHTLSAAAAAAASPTPPAAPTRPAASASPPHVPENLSSAAAAAAARASGAASRPAARGGGERARALQQMEEMGIFRRAAEEAYAAAGGDVARAVELACGGGEAEEPPPPPPAAAAAAEPPPPPPPPPPYSLAALESSLAALLDAPCRVGEVPAVPALQLVLKLLSNVEEHPDAAKFRRVRLTNPKVSAALGGGGGVALLQLCGFVACDGEYAELSDETAADRARLAESRAALELALAKAVSRPAFLGPEEVKVFAPGAAESFTRQELSGEAYELSGAEVKAAMAAAAAKREQESVLRTQAQREMEAARRKRVYTKAMIRVRFPDGVTLQGTFSAAAPVSLLCEWVGSALREPGHSFELAVPRGKPLQEMNKTLEQVELVPASLLNFRIHAAEMYDPPFLSEALLARMQQLRPEDQQIPQGRPLVADASEPRAHATPALAAAPRNPKWAPGAK